VTAVELLLYTYCSVYKTLVDWAGKYVTRDVAERLVRNELADGFRLGCNAYRTAEGPYAMMVDLLNERMLLHGIMDPLLTDAWPGRTVGIPSEADLCEIARLYSLVYHLAYTASWTFTERDEVYMWIRMTSVPVMHLNDGETTTVEWDSAPLPLRRAVKAIMDHQCGDMIICTVTAQIWADEERNGINWRERIIG